jgi:hypothetical protein
MKIKTVLIASEEIRTIIENNFSENEIKECLRGFIGKAIDSLLDESLERIKKRTRHLLEREDFGGLLRWEFVEEEETNEPEGEETRQLGGIRIVDMDADKAVLQRYYATSTFTTPRSNIAYSCKVGDEVVITTWIETGKILVEPKGLK